MSDQVENQNVGFFMTRLMFSHHEVYIPTGKKTYSLSQAKSSDVAFPDGLQKVRLF